jgi:hypothetical protein
LWCAGILWLGWLPFGRWILDSLGARDCSRSLAVSSALGMGFAGLAILAAGTAGLLYKSFILILAGLCYFAPGFHRFLLPKYSPGPAKEDFRWSDWVVRAPLAALSAYFLLLALASTLAPETAFDSLNVHLPYARDAAASHRAAFAPNNWSSVMPALPLMSYITAFLFSGVQLAKLFNFACFVMAGGLSWHFARRWMGGTSALAAALMFWSCPVALYESTTAMIDLPLAVFSALAVLSLLDWTSTGEASSLWVSALGLGLALGCKFHAGFWAAPAAAIVLLHSWKVGNRSFSESAKLALLYVSIALALFLPWILRAWFYTGNPVFPAANGIFKSPYFPPSMMEAAAAAYANEGMGTSLRALLQLPWTLTFHPGAFRGTLGFAFLPGIVLALFRADRRMRYGLILAVFYFCSWALTAQEIRYLLPLVPLLSVLSAWGFRGLTVANSGSRIPAGLIEAAGMAVVLAASAVSVPNLYSRVVSEWTYWHSYQPPFEYLAGRQSAREFLRRDVPSIYVYDWINSNLKPEDRILLLNDAAQFYSRIPTLYSFTVEAEGFLFEESEAGILQRLAKSGITHVLLNYNGIAPIPGVAPRRGVYFFLDKGFQEKHLEILKEQNKVTLYRVRKEPGI